MVFGGYTLGRLQDEAIIIQERENGRLSTEAVLVQHAVGAIESRKLNSAFGKLLKKMAVVTEPVRSLFGG